MTGKQIAVIVRQYNKEEPIKAVDVIEKNLVDVEAGMQLSRSPLAAYSLHCRSGMLILMHRRKCSTAPASCMLAYIKHCMEILC